MAPSEHRLVGRTPGQRGARAAIALALVSLAGCESRLSLGARCTRDAECAEPYACLLGTCRVECLSDRDCDLGVTCALVAPGVGACTFEVENHCTGAICPAPLVCDRDRCRAACATSADCLASQRCDGATCVASDLGDAGVPADAGPFLEPRLCATTSSCEAGEICEGDFLPTTCRTACDDHGDCPESAACDYYATTDNDAGYVEACSTVCQPGTDEGCPFGTSCRMAFRSGAVRPVGPTSITTCTPIRAGAVAGCPCEQLETSSDCAAGFSCEMPPAGRMCLRLCALDEECEPGVPCEITPRSIVIAGVQYGVCPPPSAAPTGCPTP